MQMSILHIGFLTWYASRGFVIPNKRGNRMKKIYGQLTIFLLAIAYFHPTLIHAANLKDERMVTSESAVVMEMNSGQILYEKNSQERLPPASITKIATAIYAIEKGNLEDYVTTSENARNVDGTRVYLEIDEEVPLEKLIQGLLINSGNDAGVAIAEHFSGSVEAFAEELNDFLLEEVGVENTQFKNPHGLYDPMHVTTAEDMAKITQYAMKNDTFKEFFNTINLNWDGEGWDTTLINHHILVRDQSYEGITGGKNGFVDESGFTLVTTATRGSLSLVAVTLNTPYANLAYQDAITLLDYGFTQFENETIFANEPFQSQKEKTFITTTDIAYTKRVGEEVHQQVSENGKLTIVGEDDRLLQSIQLEEVKTKEEEKQLKDQIIYAEEDDDHEGNLLPYFILGAIIFTILMALLFLMQVKKT